MTRWIILPAALLFSAAPLMKAEAQVGIKGGVSHGRISNSGLLPGDLHSRTGFAAGLSLATPPNNVLGFGIEGLYAQRGAHSASNTSSRDLDYIDVPAYLRVMAPGEVSQPFVYAGPQVSFEVRCKSGPGSCPTSDRSKVNYAAVIGAGVRIGTQTGVSIEGRYVYGLKNLKLGTVTDAESYRTRSFLILAGLSFYSGRPFGARTSSP